MTKEEFHKIIKKPKSECDGCDMHLRYCYEHNRWKSIFTSTGLNFSGFGGKESGGIDMSVKYQRPIIITEFGESKMMEVNERYGK